MGEEGEGKDRVGKKTAERKERGWREKEGKRRQQGRRLRGEKSKAHTMISPFPMGTNLITGALLMIPSKPKCPNCPSAIL